MADVPRGNAPSSQRRYWAFISYSQRDEGWARRLHQFLETYRIPRPLVGREVDGEKIPHRLVPIFRDRDELPGNPDLGAKINDALSASRSLIVICSPSAASSLWVEREISTFKSMGRAGRVLPLVVAGEPGASDKGRETTSECFPRSIRFEVTPGGVLTDRRTEPLAADARPNKDGWTDACLKLVAGILGVGFDDLRRRERARRHQQRIARAGVALAASLLLVCAYVGLADADVKLPGADAIRSRLDHFGVTVFRPVMPPDALATAAMSLRSQLRRRLFAGVAAGEMSEVEAGRDAWTTGQVTGSAFRDANATADELRELVRYLTPLFQSPEGGKADGRYVVSIPDNNGTPGRAESALWIIMALSNVLARRDVLERADIARLSGYLDIAQSVANTFHPLEHGGWNTAQRQVNPNSHFVYTTGMALHMLLEVRAAKLGWDGSREKLDRMIARTAAWLDNAFVREPGLSGWRRSLDDDKQPDSGITLLIFSALGRACAETDIRLSDDIVAAALQAQATLQRREYESPDPDIRYVVRVIGDNGSASTHYTVTRMIWYPWAIEGLVHWRRCAEKTHKPHETLWGLDRSLGHLLGDLAPSMLGDLMRRQKPLFVVAETYYGLAHAR
jgi:hypothetical protein